MANLFLLFWIFYLSAQNNYVFRKITVENGLNDAHIQSIGQDKYGYMWFGSLGGLNKYNGKEIQQYFYNVTDTNSILSGLSTCFLKTNSGQFFIGFENGIVEYNYAKNNFSCIVSLSKLVVNKLIEYNSKILIQTDEKLLVLDLISKTKSEMNEQFANYLLSKNETINDMNLHNNKLFVATNKHVYMYDLITASWNFIPELPVQQYYNLHIDKNNYLWLSTETDLNVWKFNLQLKQISKFKITEKNNISVTYGTIHFNSYDTHKTMIISKINGYSEYNYKTNDIINFKPDVSKPWSVMSNFFMSCFIDINNGVWLGSRLGVNYFHSSENAFNNFRLGFEDSRNNFDFQSRTVLKNTQNQFWFGTTDGIIVTDTQMQVKKRFKNEGDQNVLYMNLIREFCDEPKKYMWIVTSKGINRYNYNTNSIEFYTDKIKEKNINYNSIVLDKNNTIWIGAMNNYTLMYSTDVNHNVLNNVENHPVLKKIKGKGIRKLFVDRKNNLWIGCAEHGIFKYDINNNKLEEYSETQTSNYKLIGNSITDIKEDAHGIVWFTTNQSLTGINTETGIKYCFTTSNGLPTPSIFNMAIDKQDKIWIGTSKELIMLNNTRNNFTIYTGADGIQCSEFAEFSGYASNNGIVYLGTQNGFLSFNPTAISSKKISVNCIIHQFKINGKKYISNDINQMAEIKLNPTENSLQIELAGLLYQNPNGVVFAYKMEGIDKEWIYTKNNIITYHNLSGGTYLFKYKAASGLKNFLNNEKSLSIKINTVFYKTWWFILLAITAVLATIIAVYYWRIKNIRSMHFLQNKTKLLEREKTLIEFNTLKQQLNPHFLFNSLTSLGSLIDVSPNKASEFVEALSKTYRYILKSSDQTTIELEKELKFVETYYSLQKTRFGDAIDLKIEINTSLYSKKIVPVCVQNAVENAIKHNTMAVENPLTISIYNKGDYIVIENNLQKRKHVESSNQQGIKQLKDLYTYLSDKPLKIIETQQTYSIQIPLI